MTGLVDLLNAGAAFDAEYGKGLSNHRPMALLALQRLGAGDARLVAFAAQYERKLRPAPPAQAWPAGDSWRSRLGQLDAWPAYRDLFAQWLLHEGAGDVLAQTLPALMAGCGAAAFHGLIRTACAVQAAHRQELADALAYWACRWLDLGDDVSANATETDPAAVLRQLPVPRRELPGDLIFQRMQAVAAQRGFGAAASRLRIDGDTLPRLARGAAELYAASGNFTVLHLVTSAHALRVLLPFIDDEAEAAVRSYWRAFAAAWAASGAAPLPRSPSLPWKQIVARALASDDDHVIKLVDSCREQHAALGGDVWQRAATRAVNS